MSIDKSLLQLAINTLRKDPSTFITERGIERATNADGSREVVIASKNLKAALTQSKPKEPVAVAEPVAVEKEEKKEVKKAAKKTARKRAAAKKTTAAAEENKDK